MLLLKLSLFPSAEADKSIALEAIPLKANRIKILAFSFPVKQLEHSVRDDETDDPFFLLLLYGEWLKHKQAHALLSEHP